MQSAPAKQTQALSTLRTHNNLKGYHADHARNKNGGQRYCDTNDFQAIQTMPSLRQAARHPAKQQDSPKVYRLFWIPFLPLYT